MTFTQYIKLNRHGHHDGVIKVWVDGHLKYNATNLVFRKDNSIKINGIFFSTFFGGGDSSWATPIATYTLYRNFRLYDNEHAQSSVFG